MSSLERLPGRKRWRLRWREGGRGSPQLTSEWFDSRGEAEKYQSVLDGRLAAAKPLRGKLRVAMSEVITRWEKHQEGRRVPRGRRYIEETGKAMRRLCLDNKWVDTSDVKSCSHLGPGNWRLVRALLRFARDHCGQPLQPRALIAPDMPPRRQKRALIALERVHHLVLEAAGWSVGNGAIAHIVAVYGHRPQSLVQITREQVEWSWVGTNPADEDPTMGWLKLKVKSRDTIRHRLLPLTVRILAPLALEAEPGDPIFISHLGEPWETGQSYSSWFGHSVAKGDGGIYDLKRYAITWLHAGGMDVPSIASITGHRTDTVLAYLVSNEEKQASALAVMAAGAPVVLLAGAKEEAAKAVVA